ncbi:pyruvate kinase [uncultured Haemophilus sp.]|uniref:pyruvate kinase n=1 Tax=uncultured Haemophilus sp. TaxID=237779 RepID=UPI0025DE62FB|nr:pyruvate kinase [uncultured Haemophilus sp.]
MKEFDLKAALNGEPVMLRNGEKAFVKYNLLDEIENLEEEDEKYPLFGYRFEGKYVNGTSWGVEGISAYCTNEYDIIGMYEEPKKQISIEDLPKPFKPKSGDGYYYINEYGVQFTRCYDEDDDSDVGLAENAQCYRTREDAQKWIDFMKGMLE